jgi:hypothetical protein
VSTGRAYDQTGSSFCSRLLCSAALTVYLRIALIGLIAFGGFARGKWY